jgi:hypothetical protein
VSFRVQYLIFTATVLSSSFHIHCTEEKTKACWARGLIAVQSGQDKPKTQILFSKFPQPKFPFPVMPAFYRAQAFPDFFFPFPLKYSYLAVDCVAGRGQAGFEAAW